VVFQTLGIPQGPFTATLAIGTESKGTVNAAAASVPRRQRSQAKSSETPIITSVMERAPVPLEMEPRMIYIVVVTM